MAASYFARLSLLTVGIFVYFLGQFVKSDNQLQYVYQPFIYFRSAVANCCVCLQKMFDSVGVCLPFSRRIRIYRERFVYKNLVVVCVRHG